MGKLAGRVAIVTGGGWNVGRAIAVRFAREGARVAICGRREEPLRETAEAIRRETGEDALWAQADVTRLSEVEDVVARTVDRFGTVNVLAAIAGGGAVPAPVDEIDPAEWRHVISVNLVGTFHSVRSVLPTMRANGSGALLTCTGGGAFFPLLGENATAYATAKAGICRFTDQLATELIGTGIRVNCLQPGMTWNEDDLRRIEEEERRTGEPHPQRAANHAPEESAELALWLVSDESAPLTGRSVSTDDDWWRDPEKVQAVCGSMHAFALRRVEGP